MKDLEGTKHNYHEAYNNNNNNNNNSQFNSIQFKFINVPALQPEGQLQNQHNTDNNGE
jgi:hypothetical protein